MPLPAGYIREAELPAGFPAPSAVGEVLVKSYPVVRSYSAQGSGAFLKCFSYLVANKHEMTAPVVMEVASKVSEQAPLDRQLNVPVSRMHFLLEEVALDQPHAAGEITVADFAELRVVSIAHQGPLNRDTLAAARTKLDAYLAEHAEFKATGELRVLGYNSPNVPPAKQFWEFQLLLSESADQPAP